jgi:aminopeptidase N
MSLRQQASGRILLALALSLGLWLGTGKPAAAEPAQPARSANWLAAHQVAMLPDHRDPLAGFETAPRYVLDAILDVQAARISGRLTLEYTHTEEAPLSEIVLRLWPNASTIYGGGSLTVSSLTRQGLPVAWDVADDATILTVTLTPPLAPGASTTLELAFVGQIPRSGAQGYRIYHASERLISLSGWHPILAVRQAGAWLAPPVPSVGDANLADVGFYEVTLRVPTGYEVVATGVTVARQETAKGAVWRLVSGPARGFAVMISNQFQRLRATVGGVALNYYALGEARANVSVQAALRVAVDAFGTYQERFGAYPYTELDLVETGVSIGGYEFAGLVAIEHEVRQRGTYSYLRWLVAHEVAHQWWFGLVGNDSVSEPWLDESLASYAVALYLEDSLGATSGAAVLNSYRQSAGAPVGGRSSITGSAHDFGNWTAYRNPVYYQGALFIGELRQTLGDEAFFELLHRYYATYRFGHASTEGFVALAHEAAEADLDPLVARWFGRGALARLGGPLP